MRFAILVNSSAGGMDKSACEERVQLIREAFLALDVQTEVYLCSPARLTRTARQLAARNFDAVVAAGGDGTVSAVAGGLAGTKMPLAVLPFGTLNHFSKDLGVPAELTDAARAIAHGTTEAIDVGEVNGRVFINNSSIGLYPEVVKVRDHERKRRGWSKFPAMLLAVARVLYRFPLLAICVSTPERTVAAKTPFVFFGNNEYSTNLMSLGKRDCLNKGHLCVHTVRTKSRLRMLWLAIRAVFGKPEEVKDFETQQVTEASVRSKKRHLVVAVDGEITTMRSPLLYRVRAGALLVRRPATETASIEPSAPVAIGAQR